MKISILTLFPEMFVGPLSLSIIKRAQEKKLVEINYVNIRDFGLGKHQVVDDTPYGGGVGMIMRVDVLHKAIESVRNHKLSKDEEKVVLMDPRGKTFNQSTARDYTRLQHLILLCGHYEGYDERIRQFIDEEISLGDFVLTGGEIPVMAIVDATVRLLPGVITETATETESFSKDNLLDFPQYTKPAEYEHSIVPETLRSGDHKKIEHWRKEQAIKITKKYRPDMRT